MWQRWFFVLFLAYFLLTNKCEASQRNKILVTHIPYVISRLFEKGSNSPIIFYFDPILLDRHLNPKYKKIIKPQKPKLRDEELNLKALDGYEDDMLNLRSTQYDERAYILYHLLRSTLEEDNLDRSTATNLHYTKEILRQALRNRCKRLLTCIKNCIKDYCKQTCQQIFDDLDVCEKPKIPDCSNNWRPQCGKTMPPKWLLRH